MSLIESKCEAVVRYTDVDLKIEGSISCEHCGFRQLSRSPSPTAAIDAVTKAKFNLCQKLNPRNTT